MKNYLWETFTSLLERFWCDSSLPLTTITILSSVPIVYFYPLAFPIRQITKLPIRIPSEEFWIRSRHKLDAFLDVLRNLLASQQIIFNMKDNFHFGLNYGMNNFFWIFNGLSGITFSPTFFQYCKTNWFWFLFKQHSIKALDLIFNCAYTPRGKKNKDKIYYYRAQILLFFSFFYSFFPSYFLNLVLVLVSFLYVWIELTLDVNWYICLVAATSILEFVLCKRTSDIRIYMFILHITLQ